MNSQLTTRIAMEKDIGSIRMIYNQGIEDRIATLETEPKDEIFMKNWFEEHQGRYSVLVAEQNEEVIGWASLNPYSNRCAYNGVADLSVYIRRDYRGKGIGTRLLQDIEALAIQQQFNKIILFTFSFNTSGQGLYKKCGYRKVGVLERQGYMDGKFIDVMIMEKILIDK